MRKFFGGRAPISPQADQMKIILGKYLDGDFRVFPMVETKTCVGQIEAIGKQFGVKYPPELVAHICGRFPGIYVEVKEDVWPRPEAFQVAPFWSFLYALHTFTPAPGSEGWMRLELPQNPFKQRLDSWQRAPVLKVIGDADLYCVDVDGRRVQFDHETNELKAFELNFWQLFEREVSELRTRKMRKQNNCQQ